MGEPGPRRPDPESLLALVQAEEERARRGRLKVFLGATAGVGKTYAMLEAAHELARRGGHPVVGCVETHGRRETEALLTGLERLPSRAVEHRGLRLQELDLDAALTRGQAPGTVLLVDELAHSNASGSRHPKRWQDVEELLAAGVDVYTTVNVQHFESLQDVVGQITGILVRETVPDSLLDLADQVELIDLPVEDLIKRLGEGKVYLPEQAARAAEGFFRPGNLIALRELALRKTAERVDAQMQRYRELHGIAATWPVAERLLVAVGPDGPGGSEAAARLVRAGSRLASRLQAEWIVAYVETPREIKRQLELPREAKVRLMRTLRLAEQLGAEVAVLWGQRAAEELVRYARRRNVTKIVVGKPRHPRWRDRLFGSVRDELERTSGAIDVWVIAGDPESAPSVPERPSRPSRRQLAGYLAAVVVPALATGLCALLVPVFQLPNLMMIYLLATVGLATRCGRGPTAVAAVLSVIGFDYYFVPPSFSFAVSDTEYLLTFGAMLVTSLLISTLTGRLRLEADAARQREQRMAALHALSRDLVAAPDLDALLRAAARRIASLFPGTVGLWLPDASGRLALRAIEPREDPAATEPREEAVARWVFDRGQPAGATTDTLPAARGLYLPLAPASGVVGVLGVLPETPEDLAAPEPRHLLEALANQVALAIG